MPRMYVPSTPETRGEVPFDPDGLATPDPLVGLTNDQLARLAADRGFKLEPVEKDKPSGNASAEEWRAYAKDVHGARDEDLVDADGRPLSRNDLRDRYGRDATDPKTRPDPGEPSAQADEKPPADDVPTKKSGQPVEQRTSATRPSATQDSAAPASESKVKPS